VKRIPALDGWRGIAIAMVLFDHIQLQILRGYARPWTDTGLHGVTIFFVLSGFLITSNLVRQPINPRHFYLRRFFRLMPAAWTYLGTLMLIDRIAHTHATTPAGTLACLFFYRNFFATPAVTLTGHFWSLSIEEQFYMIWPCTILLAGAKRSRWIAGAGAVACAGCRQVFWTHYTHGAAVLQTQVRADALLVGCLLALLIADTRIREVAGRWSKFWMLPLLAALLCGIALFHWIPPLFESVAIAGLIGASVIHPRTLFARSLAFAPLAWLGRVSYSVYLWQQLFTPFGSFVALCIALPAAALGSYYFVELPFTRLGHHLTKAAAPSVPPSKHLITPTL
jgi:peptidoglycan/LPS O-acetylase OafA/YrhL